MTSRQHSYKYLRHGRSSRSLSNLFGDDHSATTTNNVNSTATFKEVQTFQSQSSLTDESAPWSTRKTILLTEALVVTAIVIPLVFCFFYHRVSKTTSSSLRSHVAATANTATNNNNNLDLGTASLTLDATTDAAHDHQQYDGQAEAAAGRVATAPTSAIRRAMQTIVSLPSTLLSVLLYPIHLIDEGVNSWSTANADITFLRSVMERLEEERLAQLEDAEERGERLKMAFSKGKMVWEIGEEHFTPPPINVENNIDGTDHTTASSSYVNNSSHKVQLQREAVEEEIIQEEGGREDEVALAGERKEEQVGEHDEGVVVGDAVEQKQQLDYNNCDDENIMEATAALDGVEERDDGKEEGAEKEGEGVDNAEQSSSLMTMDETKREQDKQSLRPTSNEGEDIIIAEPPLTKNTAECSTLFDNPPPRSMSPLEEVLIPDDGLGATATTTTTPAYLFLSHRRNRANTNETNSSTIPSLASSSSLSHHNLPLSQSSESFVSASSANDNIPSVEEGGEEELKSVPNNCAICLDAYVSGDTIVTSCNPLCPHAFHQECIIEWLVKMQEGTPCPCCRRTFVELSPSRPTTTTANVAIPRQTTSPEQEERRRVELQRTIELGIRRGRAFDISVISLR